MINTEASSNERNGKVESEQADSSIFSVLWPPDWFTDPDASSVLVRIYVAIISHEDIKAFSGDFMLRDYIARHRIAITPFHVENFKIRNIEANLCHTTQDLRVEMKLGEQEISEGYYFSVVTPIKEDGVEHSEAHVNSLLDRAVGIMRATLGTNYLRKLIFTGMLSGSGRSHSMHSPIIKMPMPVEKTPIHEYSVKLVADLFDAIHSNENQHRDSTELALQYLFRGTETSEFLNYWTAMEIVCGGTAPKMRHKMHLAYKCRLHEAETRYGLARVRRWRHELIHNGKVVNLSAEVERLLQMLIIDLICCELEIECRQLLPALARFLEIDLSSIEPDARGIFGKSDAIAQV